MLGIHWSCKEKPLRGRSAKMAIVVFIITTIAVSAAASLIKVDAGTSRRDSGDYHFVPYSGDAFGA